MSETLPIETLIRERAAELGLGPTELIRRAGYKNVSKGLRRLTELYQGDFEASRGLISLMPDVLRLSAADVQNEVQNSRRQIAEAEEAKWRAAFAPHAVILTERARPHGLFIVAMIGISELKRLDFALGSYPVTYVQQALDGVQRKMKRWGRGQLPYFGRPDGIIINYTPDWAVRFDLNGKAVESFDAAYRLGEATLSVRGRALSAGELRCLFGDGSSAVEAAGA
jgi:hypothetical protein